MLVKTVPIGSRWSKIRLKDRLIAQHVSISYTYSKKFLEDDMCAARFSKCEDWPKCYFLPPFLDLASVSNIHDRGHKHAVHVKIGVNHVIIA